MKRLLLAAAVASVVACAGSAQAGRAASTATCGKLLAPAEGAYFGAKPGWRIEPYAFDDIVDSTVIDAFEAAGRRMAFATFSTSWHDGLPFPARSVRELWRHGQMPIVRIFSFPTQDFHPAAVPAPGPITHSAIVAGRHDAEIRAWANAARATNIPIGLDYDPEMNSAHPWGGRFDGGKRSDGYGDPAWPDGPELFRDAFRRIVTIFREAGASNVTFFFHPNTPYGYLEGSYSEPFERFHWYFPGDDYVDWLGFSVYAETSKPDGSHLSFEEKLQTFHAPDWPGSYADLTSLSSRPLAINELGLYKMPSEQQKTAWAVDASTVIRSGRYPRIGLINWWGDNQGADYDAWPGTFSAGFKAAFELPFFDPKLQFSGNCLPAAPAKVTLRGRTLSWAAVPNATSYEVWRGGRRIARPQGQSIPVAPGVYRVRGVNPLGVGPFAATRR